MFKRKCKHEWSVIGLFYKENLTQYRNYFDKVEVYQKHFCCKCCQYKDELISIEFFMPELYHGRDERKTEYIQKLNKKGILDEIDLLYK